MMLAEVKLVLDSKMASDKGKGEETSTTKTKCVHPLSRSALPETVPAACLRKRMRT
jgi:hypothetical protein